jgi:MFS family permease
MHDNVGTATGGALPGAAARAGKTAGAMTGEEARVIVASSIGTAFEWYDFFLFGALTPVIGAKFFGGFNPATQTIFALLTFAAGFAVRPIGALGFARFGDVVGRKSVFLLTLVCMGGSTVAVGLMPTSAQIGLAAPVMVLVLRVVQGLAISGEFGGAVVYVAEHAPIARRGFYAGWIPATVGLSVAAAIGVLLACQAAVGAAAFDAWGWRLPFIVSVVPLGVSVWIRTRLHESPAFLRMKAQGRQSRAPIGEAFGRWRNLRLALVLLFGLVAPHAMIGYLSTFYALVLLTTALNVDGFTANCLFVTVMLAASALCVFWSWLSDRVGRKPVVIGAFALAVATIFPVFGAIERLANPALAQAQRTIAVDIAADHCAVQFNPAGMQHRLSDCDRAKLVLARYSVSYTHRRALPGAPVTVTIGTMAGGRARHALRGPGLEADLARAVLAAGYPAPHDPGIIRIARLRDLVQPRAIGLFALLTLLTCYGQMGQGPSAAAMVELFPTRIRYTAISLPFQIGTGWFGGLLPAVMVAINAEAGNLFAGLWYPVGVIALGALVSLLFLPETRGRDLDTMEGER